MYFIAALLLISSFGLFLWFSRNGENKLNCILTAACAGLALIFLFLSFAWGLAISYYIRYFLVLLYLFFIIRAFVKIRKQPVKIGKGPKGWIIPSLSLLICSFLIFQTVVCLSGYFYKEAPVNLSFPFRNGVYSAFFGGNGENSVLMNYHFKYGPFIKAGVNSSMKYATDITKLNFLGSDRHGISSTQLEKFEIFAEKLYSPCDGEITDIQSGWRDIRIGEREEAFNTGNTIIVKTGEAYILLGHLKEGSIVVKVGDKVKQGQLLAEVGSSGLSGGQPHLHMQALKGPYWGAEGLPIVFDGVFPVKNCLFIR